MVACNHQKAINFSVQERLGKIQVSIAQRFPVLVGIAGFQSYKISDTRAAQSSSLSICLLFSRSPARQFIASKRRRPKKHLQNGPDDFFTRKSPWPSFHEALARIFKRDADTFPQFISNHSNKSKARASKKGRHNNSANPREQRTLDISDQTS